MRWLYSVPRSSVFMSVLTVGEISKGIARLGAGRRKNHLQQWLTHELPEWFDGRVLSVDWNIAHEWGRLTAMSNENGRPLPAIDGLLAATALHHGLVLVTRDTSEVTGTGVPVLNPWLP
jgi:predicted nucleic acid-binding protein